MHYFYGNVWGMPHMYGYGFDFLSILFWLFVIFVGIRLLRNSKIYNDMGHGKDPVDILKERYAKGEIKKEEFESMKKDLS